MKKIIITENLDLSREQIGRLKSLGNLKIFKEPAKSSEEWLERCKNAEFISGRRPFIEKNYHKLKNIFISVGFVEVGWADSKVLTKNNITLKNAPGCNKEAVSEWIIGMMINLFRKLHEDINKFPKEQTNTVGLAGKNVCILGKGNIGNRVGDVCRVLKMNVSYLTRKDNLLEKTKNKDIIINCLNRNPSTVGLLNKTFFTSLRDAYFISVSDKYTFDMDAMINAVDKGNVAGVALDASVTKGTTDPLCKKLHKHPNIILTRIAARTDVTAKVANDMMIDNIEKFITSSNH